MIKKIVFTCLLSMTALFGVAQQSQPDVVVKVVDPNNGIDTVLYLSNRATVSFEKYRLPLPDGLYAVDMGLSVKWCSRNYYHNEDNAELGNELFDISSNTDLVADDWGVLYDQPWRMPTKEEFDELLDTNNCTWEYKEAKSGFLVTSIITGDSIFLPCVGLQEYNKEREFQGRGYYWPLQFENESLREGNYYEIYYDTQGRVHEMKYNYYSDVKTTKMSIRPVLGAVPSKPNPLINSANARDYRSATIDLAFEKVEKDDITDCGIYFDPVESNLPSKLTPSSESRHKTVMYLLSADCTASCLIDNLISGTKYYVCAYVKTAKGTFFSEPTSFEVMPATVGFAGTAPKVFSASAATVALQLQAYPMDSVSRCGVLAVNGTDTLMYTATKPVATVDVALNNLAPSTTYECTAFIIFGNDSITSQTTMEFTTKSKIQPTIQNAVSNDYKSATISLTVANAEKKDIAACRIYYATSASDLPSDAGPGSNAQFTDVELSDAPSATVTLNNLVSGATYHACAYVKTEQGDNIYSTPVSFDVKPASVSFAGKAPKAYTESTATLTLNLQANPHSKVERCGVNVVAGETNMVFKANNPSTTNVDVELTNLIPSTTYTCTAFVIFNNDSIPGKTPLTFTTKAPRPVNETFPIPEWMVDLGLPSGLLWAPYNFGDKDENGLGQFFFGWGDPTGKAISTGNGSEYADGEQILDIAASEYDVATIQWGEGWRLPQKSDFRELFESCLTEEKTKNGILGIAFKNKDSSKSTEELWLPLPGAMNPLDSSITGVGTDGFYWTSEAELSKRAIRLRLRKTLNDYNFEAQPRGTRSLIRPVYGPKDINNGGTPQPVEPQDPTEDLTIHVGGYDTDTEEGAETAYPEEAVDMGLPSETRWASWNVGVMNYGELGKYYAWGEITQKETYTPENYYAPGVRGFQVTTLPDSTDVAQQLWKKGEKDGQKWMMPTIEDFDELFKEDPSNPGTFLYVTVKWDSDSIHGDHYGLRVTSIKTGNSIFLPAGGDKSTKVNETDIRGYYWTSTGTGTSGGRTTHAVCFEFMSDMIEARNLERFDGCMVRPVFKKTAASSRKVKSNKKLTKIRFNTNH